VEFHTILGMEASFQMRPAAIKSRFASTAWAWRDVLPKGVVFPFGSVELYHSERLSKQGTAWLYAVVLSIIKQQRVAYFCGMCNAVETTNTAHQIKACHEHGAIAITLNSPFIVSINANSRTLVIEGVE